MTCLHERQEYLKVTCLHERQWYLKGLAAAKDTFREIYRSCVEDGGSHKTAVELAASEASKAFIKKTTK